MRTCARTGGVNPALGGIIQGEDFVEAQNKWQCPSCTVLNPNRLRYCKLDGCNTARPGPRPASPPRDCMRATPPAPVRGLHHPLGIVCVLFCSVRALDIRRPAALQFVT